MSDKKITIEDHMQLAMAKKLFNEAFPFLRLEFYPVETGVYPGTGKVIQQSATFASLRRNHHHTSFVITPEMTVTELDQSFNNDYGLETQIFRKSGKIWLETTLTEQWTLEEQNRQGEALSL